MTFPLTTAQALKSLAGVVLFGLGLDPARFVSCQLRQLLSFAIREGIGLLFCGVPVLAWLARTVARARFPGAFSGCGGLIAHPRVDLKHGRSSLHGNQRAKPRWEEQ